MADVSLPTEETSRLISSDKVEGTAVYGRDRSRLGSVHTVMLDKRSGRVEYAVLSYGGIFGIGDDYYPLPWSVLTYDTELGGYVVDLDNDQLKNGPHYSASSEPDFDEPYNQDVFSYYGQSYPY